MIEGVFDTIEKAIDIVDQAVTSQDYSQMSKQLNEIAARLPGLDCGSCGSPSCKALAEDIVRGDAYESDCIFKMKERIQDIFRSLADMEHITVRDPEKRERDEKGEDRT